MAILGVALVSVLLAGLVLVIHGTAVRNKWGFNLDGLFCPRCQAAVPTIRVPKTTAQWLWGGSTCQNCGCAVDKWGREVSK